MRSILITIFAVLVASVLGCQPTSPATAPASASLRSESKQSLAPQPLPAKIRIALMRLRQKDESTDTPADWALMDAGSADRIVGRLKSSPRVADVIILPPWTVPAGADFSQVRQAAKNAGADVALVYRPEYRNTWQPPDTRATCAVAAVLLDAGSDQILFSTVAGGAAQGPAPRDLPQGVAIDRTEQEAAATALSNLADKISNFLAAERPAAR